MKITNEWLLSQGACSGGRDWFGAQKQKHDVGVLKSLIKEERFDYAYWLVRRVLNRKQLLKMAIFAAEQVLGIYEEKHPTDTRVRVAIEAARAVLRHDTPDNREKARVARNAAADAAAAAYAAYAAAAYAAADAAAAAYAFGFEPIRALFAASNRAKVEMKVRILNFALKLIIKRKKISK